MNRLHYHYRVAAGLIAMSVLAAGLISRANAQTLLVRYAFDEGSGTTAADSGTGTAANGTLQGNAGWTTNTPGGTGSALNISSGQSTDYVTAGTVSKVQSLSQFTVTLWINLQGAPVSGDRLFATIGGGRGISLMLLTPPSGTLSAAKFGLGLAVDGYGGADLTKATVSLNADKKWLFLAVTYDGNATTSNVLFYSGYEATSVSQLGTAKNLPNGVVDSPSGALEIGSYDGASTDVTPAAYLDDVRLYSGVLSSADLEQIRLSAVPEPGVLGFLISGTILMMVLKKLRSGKREEMAWE